MDLNRDDPSWEPMAPISRPGVLQNYARMSRQGLFPYKDDDGELTLFAVFLNMCYRIGSTTEERGLYFMPTAQIVTVIY